VRRPKSRTRVGLVRRDEIPFLLRLWAMGDVMHYADELPSLRCWTKSWAPSDAWREYMALRARTGPMYSQLIVRTPGGKPIGESFFAPLPEGYDFGPWRKPRGRRAVMGDIKLLPRCWNRGLGSEAMMKVVRWLFRWTSCDLIIVPPHRRNQAANRVYEKSGFVLYPPMERDRGHRVMELTRKRFEGLPGRG
jgi:RimJ/RimL family protein N-acetyltransferase